MKTVYVVGTRHEFQIAAMQVSPRDAEAFKRFVGVACKRFRVRAIAEELSMEVLRQHGRDESLCQQLARSLSLAHRFCDPESAIREEHGIRPESDLHMEVVIGRLRPEELDGAIRREHEKRERIWLDHLRHLDVWPVLFICGAKHTRSFGHLLKEEGLSSEVLIDEWSPTQAARRAKHVINAIPSPR